MDLVHNENSRYGNIAVTQWGGQYTFFTDGVPVITAPVPDVGSLEDRGHFPMLLHDRPERVLILGGGPDARPLARLALEIGLDVTVADHRPAYADPGPFPGCRVVCSDADAIGATLDLDAFDAAVVMSHHLASDALYLRALGTRTGRAAGAAPR